MAQRPIAARTVTKPFRVWEYLNTPQRVRAYCIEVGREFARMEREIKRLKRARK